MGFLRATRINQWKCCETGPTVSPLLDPDSADESKWKLMRKYKISAKVPSSNNLASMYLGTHECPGVFTAQLYCASSFCQDGGMAMEVTEWSVFKVLKSFKWQSDLEIRCKGNFQIRKVGQSFWKFLKVCGRRESSETLNDTSWKSCTCKRRFVAGCGCPLQKLTYFK